MISELCLLRNMSDSKMTSTDLVIIFIIKTRFMYVCFFVCLFVWFVVKHWGIEKLLMNVVISVPLIEPYHKILINHPKMFHHKRF